MPYKVICYSHKPVKSWGPYQTEQEAINKVNSHPGHSIDYYPVAGFSDINARLKKLFRNVGIWNPPILNDRNIDQDD